MSAESPGNAEMVVEIGRLSRSLEEALDGAREWAVKYANAENVYRLARARNQLSADEGLFRRHKIEKPTVDQRSAWVDLMTSAERQAAHEAEWLMKASFEAVRSRRAQLSALQSIAASVRAEAELAR